MAYRRVYEFISKPNGALICRICLEVAREPWQHEECGVLFCEQCIKKYGRNKACPHCRVEQPRYFKDSRGKRDIKALPVKCDNAGRGCKWEGTVGTLNDHVTKVCQFTPVPCPNGCKGGSTEEETTFIIFLHALFGNKTQHIMKKDLEKHLKECPNREHQCEYCGKKGTYVSIMMKHDSICEKKRIYCINSSCHKTIERGKMDAHVANDCEYTEISCKYESIGCDAKIKRKYMRAHEEDDKVHLHMALGTIVKLKKTTEKLTEKLEEKSEELRKATKKLRNMTEELEVKTKRNTELIRNAMEGKSTTFKLPDFYKKKVNNECFVSPSFYTSPTGYHMFFRVYPNGCKGSNGYSGIDAHVSVVAVIMKGKYDEKLKWPFIGKVSIELLNQLEDKNHYNVNLELMANSDFRVGGNGFIQSIPHSLLPYNSATGAQYTSRMTLCTSEYQLKHLTTSHGWSVLQQL